MDIRPITIANLDECIGIFMKAYNAPPWNYNWTPEKSKQYLSEYAVNPHFAGFILYDDNEPAGAVLAHKKTWWTSPQLFIDEFFITPNKQRMGYGKALMDHCTTYANDNELKILVLMTNKYMPSFKFYNKIGYTTTEQFTFMFKQVI
ncbi:MAG: GNAT family N-acetyltransferase [Bacteroidota bacterium]